MRKLHAEQPRGIEKPAEVVQRTKQIQLLVGLIPIRPQPAEDSGSVIQGMGQNADLRLVVGDDLAAEVGKIRQRHFLLSFIYSAEQPGRNGSHYIPTLTS